jgi:RHS repeat-associated protein
MTSQKTNRLLLFICILIGGLAINTNAQQIWNPNHSIGTATGNYNSATITWPVQLTEIYPAAVPNTGLTYQWEQSNTPVSGFTNISGATATSYSLSNPGQTKYYRRKTTNASAQSIYSNTIKITFVSPTWEDINYIREYNVTTTAITTATALHALAIGPKLQTTTYLDGLGRPTQKISKETAIPPSGTLWNDIVQFSQYDQYGREQKKYLPYTTGSQPGKYKTAPVTDQASYYSANYNETFPYSQLTFDNSPLNQVMNVKQPGTAWAAGAGIGAVYDVNDDNDYVRIFKTDYIQGNAPVSVGFYPAKTLYKLTTLDENGKKVIEFTNKSGQLILKKVQLDDVPASAYTGWICTYSVYDDFGLLRYQLQPEAVKYLDANSWSFAGANGTQVLNEYCFQYNYDEKGRNTWKKAPGALPLKMIYDSRDRVVFMQDGNQSILATPQWTANIYDELDRPVITTLYNTNKTIAQLQTDINNAAASTTISITSGSNNGGTAVTVKTSYNPIPQTSFNNASITVVLTYKFYDDYTYTAVKAFNTGFTNTTAYSTSDPNVQPIATTQRTTSMLTGTRTRVLTSTKFLFASQYYDERGMPIQLLEDNIQTSGLDITTLQYHFDGRVLSTCTDHTTNTTGYTNYKILTKYNFDKLARVTSLEKKFGTNAFKVVSEYIYDDMGRVKTKRLDPGYTAGGNAELEALNYSFNIHNQITGINKDYALKSGVYNKWSHFFGLYLGFDNRDGVFTNPNLNGQVTGLLWNTQGDDAQRRYNYTYDNAGRLINAAYTEKEKPADTWANNKMDFSVSGFTNNKIKYDLNGNLLEMLHKGVVPGTTTPITVDDLRYSYTSASLTYTNKLQAVTDMMTVTGSNGLFGDFKDGTNGTNPDYVYDDNGNIIVDLNKSIQSLGGGAAGTKGIQYNYLDKPDMIRITGKGHIRIVYDANGRKLQRAFIPEAGGTSVITSYINGYVYQKSETITTATVPPFAVTGGTVSFINFEEGRVRVITPTNQNNGLDAIIVDGNMDLPNSKRGAYDFFIMDYQQNVRMIVTEETHTAFNTATMETARATLEQSIFGQAGANNEVSATRVAKPAGWTNANIGTMVSKLGTTFGKNIGPNTLQKVMAGDKVTATVQYWYQGTAGGNNTNFPAAVVNSLLPAITGGSAAPTLVKNNASAITTNLQNDLTGFVAAVQPNGSNPGGNTPQAFLTILFFDERFKFIAAADGGVAQQQVASSVTADGSTLVRNDIKAPKNGYAYVYVSNQSNQDVFFDNLKVQVVTGNIIEENHYYAYGLKIAAISSKKLPDTYEGVIKNNYLYNDKELFDDGDLNWYDYGFRNYDPQIGRFPQIDPLTDYFPFLTPYQYASCEPIANIDLDGLESVGSIGGATSVARDFAYVYQAASTSMMWITPIVRTASGVSAGSNILSTVISISSIVIQTSITVTNAINNGINTKQAGDRALIVARGSADAILNANTFGLTDFFGSTSNLGDYSEPDDQAAYLEGRLLGDAFVMAQSAAEISGGIKVGGSLALTSGGTSAIAGGAVIVHGVAIRAVAMNDAAWATAKLLQLNASAKTSSGNTPPNNGNAVKHGETPHDNAINNRINQLRNDKNVRNIRKNQRQVDVNGKRVGKLRNTPDIQFDKYNPKTKQWEHHVIEYDNVQKNSTIHGIRLKYNDPNAKIELNVL